MGKRERGRGRKGRKEGENVEKRGRGEKWRREGGEKEMES